MSAEKAPGIAPMEEFEGLVDGGAQSARAREKDRKRRNGALGGVNGILPFLGVVGSGLESLSGSETLFSTTWTMWYRYILIRSCMAPRCVRCCKILCCCKSLSSRLETGGMRRTGGEVDRTRSAKSP